MPDAALNQKCVIDITGMTCTACAGRIEKVLRARPEIAQVHVDLGQDRAVISPALGVRLEEAEAAALLAIAGAGYKGYAQGTSLAERQAARVARAAGQAREQFRLQVRALVALVIATPFLVAMVMETLGGAPGHLISPAVQGVLASVSQLYCAWPFYGRALASVKARSANMDVLVVLGTLTAYVLSLWHLINGSAHHGAPLYFEGSVAVIAFVLLGKLIERVARREAGAALSALADLIPPRIEIVEKGVSRDIAREELAPGMLVVAKPGAVLAVDGEIAEGEAFFDESSLTGESLPVAHGVGDAVRAGSGVSGGRVVVRASGVNDETRLARLARLIEDAGLETAPAATLADRISQVFVPAIIVLALAAAAFWLWQGEGLERALIIATSVLVVACPCALGLATPIALVAGASRAAKRGILLADHAALEAGARLTHVAFDKTGTLSEGKPALIRIAGVDEEGALRLASRLAARSDHPLDSAIVAAARARGAFRDGVEDFTAKAGAGLSGRIEGQEIRLGAKAFVEDEVGFAVLEAELSAEEHQRPASYLSVDGAARAIFVLGDPLRLTAVAAIAALKAEGIIPVMLSGDREAVVRPVAAMLGIADARGGLKPEDKLAALENLMAQGAVLGFVGDGLNDGPALRAAHVGIAMGSGTDVAKGAASVILARPDPALVVDFVKIARKTRAGIRENLFLAFLFNGLAVPLAMAGKLSPAIAGAAMACSSLSVALNALRISRSSRL
jgi:P-type Cu+ transporter